MCEPRKLDHDAWESRCPAHGSLDHALSITRNEFNHVVLNCRSEQNCTHLKVIRSLGITNELLYAETPEWSMSQLQRAAAQLSSLVGDGAGNPRHIIKARLSVRDSKLISKSKTAIPAHPINPETRRDRYNGTSA